MIARGGAAPGIDGSRPPGRRTRVPRRAGVALVRLAVVLAVAGCGGATTSVAPSSASGPSSSPAGPPSSAAAVTSPVDGVPIAIDASGLTKVSAFTVRTDDGRSIVFTIGQLENGDQFPPGHLAEHLAASTKVRVWFRAEGGNLVAYRLEDAPAP